MLVVDLVNKISESAEQSWSKITFSEVPGRGVPRYFHAFFIPLWELMVVDGLQVRDVDKLAKSLKNFWSMDFTIPRGGNWGVRRKGPLFAAIKANLRPHFKKSNTPLARRIRETEAAFTVELQMALTESSLFELKQGFTRLDGSRLFDENAFDKVLRTASAMANHGPSARGFIVFGVADDAADADRVREIYGIDSIAVNGFDITGTQHELDAMGVSRDEWLRQIIARIKSTTKLETDFAGRLASSLTLLRFEERVIWTLEPKGASAPTMWDGKYWIRQGNSTIEASGAHVIDLVRRFPNA